MARPTKKQMEEAKKSAVASAPIVAPAPLPIAIPAVQPAPLVAPGLVHQQPRHIDPEGFIRVRDSVHQRLLTILELIKSFSVDYYRQTNLLLGESANEGIPGIDIPITNLEHAAQHLVGINGLMQAGPDYGAPIIEEKKERKKRTHDPNAPKRPLTPYFLYMQTARPIIASDLGADAPKGAVQEEGQRRWKAMGQQEKSGWNNAYQYNLRLYQARVHSYKAGNLEARVMNDDDALVYADNNDIPLPHVDGEAVADDQDAIAQQLQQAAPVAQASEEEASEEETPAPSKTPKKAASRKRKSDAADVEPKSTPAAATPADKKRRRVSKAVDTETKDEPTATKKSRGKKAKN
ncbi:hypothetical protein VD0002_g8407 [Verticillium dahliae]|uniref:HMG box domain-containing protein n=3 Tax=Verticillium TaxID=1036719 RepID=A0A2J8CP06_VERDA|nr:Putative glutamine amidotransferase-like protein C13C5.04 [Verticillium dahliae VDG2]KAG7100719.1 hypothetical protein HYQ44_020071 [Verticillium longisporum]KAH6701654.1 hypothetical protein EV126DRAFT_419594 [Verticillium dahliae]PNH32436.1 hypothetical protein BJF96_g4266 [Verticillium dahliae]PNH38746.1 hypothetical protein VD0004_g8101 [Verticillium dahliae]